MGNFLADLRPERLPAHQKKEGSDWYAVFNPQTPRLLDVDLVHTLQHDSVVCCVRFSLDGKYVATGCNRAAQIFDVATGSKVSYLEDASVDKDGDLYIRSVCFSPDGRYLATGAEDKQIRVSFPFSSSSRQRNDWVETKRRRDHGHPQLADGCIFFLFHRFGTSLREPSSTPFPATSKTFTRWTTHVPAGTSHPVAGTGPSVSGTSRRATTC